MLVEPLQESLKGEREVEPSVESLRNLFRLSGATSKEERRISIEEVLGTHC